MFKSQRENASLALQHATMLDNDSAAVVQWNIDHDVDMLEILKKTLRNKLTY